jgi:hypothetical protein
MKGPAVVHALERAAGYSTKFPVRPVEVTRMVNVVDDLVGSKSPGQYNGAIVHLTAALHDQGCTAAQFDIF